MLELKVPLPGCLLPAPKAAVSLAHCFAALHGLFLLSAGCPAAGCPALGPADGLKSLQAVSYSNPFLFTLGCWVFRGKPDTSHSTCNRCLCLWSHTAWQDSAPSLAEADIFCVIAILTHASLLHSGVYFFHKLECCLISAQLFS